MNDAGPEGRIVERTRGQPDLAYDGVVVAIPLAYVAGLVAWWAVGLDPHVALGGSSVLAAGALADALFVHPPSG
jgi:hypothetical protein